MPFQPTPGTVTAITAIIGVLIAKSGLSKWRTEAIGKRKAELAEQALTLFYEIADVFIWARSPGSFKGDGETRTLLPHETTEQRDARNTYFIPLERLTRETELFSRLQSLRYTFLAYFGEEAIGPFKEVRELHTSIASSAAMLITMIDEDGLTASYAGQDSGADLRTALWGDGIRPDQFDQSMKRAIEQIEGICKPVLEAQRSG